MQNDSVGRILAEFCLISMNFLLLIELIESLSDVMSQVDVNSLRCYGEIKETLEGWVE